MALRLMLMVALWAVLPAHTASATELDVSGDDVLELPEIVVTGTRTEKPLADAPVQVELITRSEIENSGARDAADILETQHGIALDRTWQGTEISMQGLDSRYVLILIDGQRVAGRTGGAVDLTRIDVNQIERVEIVKGAASALYGSDAIGGVINIITRKVPAKPAANLSTRYGSRRLVDLNAAGSFTAATLATRFEAGWARQDGFDRDLADIATDGSDDYTLRLGNSTRWFDLERVRLDSRVNYQFRDAKGINVSGTGAVFDRQNRTEELSGEVSPTFKLGAADTLRLTAYYGYFDNQYVSDQRSSGELDAVEATQEQVGQLTLQHDHRWRSNVLSLGAEVLEETIASDRVFNPKDRQRYSLFAQDEWTPFAEPKLIVVPGVRGDWDSQFGGATSPKVTVRFDPTEKVVLRVTYGHGFRAPDFKQLYIRFENQGSGYIVVGNPDLGAERSKGANAGVEVQPLYWLWLAVNGYYNRIDDMINSELVGGGNGEPNEYSYVNVSAARTAGVESLVNLTPAEGLALKVGYSYLSARDLELDRPLEFQTRHRVNGQVHYEYEPYGLGATIRGVWTDGKPYFDDVDGNGVEERYETPDYAIFNARLAHDIRDWLTLFAGVDNLGDVGDAEFLAIAPRTYYGGLEISY